MAQGHLDRLTSIDVSFLTNESSSSHMHVGGDHDLRGPAAQLRGPPRPRRRAGFASSRASARSSPIRRRRPAGRSGSTIPAFNLDYHVRHSALPRPGLRGRSCAAWRRASSRSSSTAPSRSGSSGWSQGLTRKRFALLTKTHHALVDGVSGVDIATVLFDVKPVPEPRRRRRRLGSASPSPSSASPARQGRRGRRAGADRRRCAALEHGHRAPADRRRAASRRRSRRVGEVGWNFANPAPEVPLNVEIGSHRRFAWVRERPGPVQEDQGRARRHRQRRRARGCRRRASRVAARPRDPHRGPRAARPGPGEHPRRRRARPARQQARGHARPAAGLHRRPGSPARDGDARRWRG